MRAVKGTTHSTHPIVLTNRTAAARGVSARSTLNRPGRLGRTLQSQSGNQTSALRQTRSETIPRRRATPPRSSNDHSPISQGIKPSENQQPRQEHRTIARYNSFNSSDCTYQPYGGGPRRLCEIDSERQNLPVAEREPDQRVAPNTQRDDSAPKEAKTIRKRVPRESETEGRAGSPFVLFGPREQAESGSKGGRAQGSRWRLPEPSDQAPRGATIKERPEPGPEFFRGREPVPPVRAEERRSRSPFWFW
jgi:hypothetical protein